MHFCFNQVLSGRVAVERIAGTDQVLAFHYA